MKLKSRLSLTTTALSLLAVVPASAQLYFDTNGATAGTTQTAGTFTWDTGTNWSTDATGSIATTGWVNGSNVIFSAGTEGAVAYTITIGGTVQTNSITFNQALDSTHTISGGTISAGAAPLALSASAAGTATNRSKTISSALTGTGGLTIAANGDTSDTGGGSNTVFAVTGANTISGNVTITSGVVTTNSSFGDAANTITLSGGGLVDTGANTNFTRSLIIPTGQSGTYRTYGGSVGLGRISGSLSGAGNFRHSDTGTLYLSGDKSGFTGTVTNGAGTLILEQANWSANDFVLTDNTNVLRLGLAGDTTIKSLTSDRDVVIPFGSRLNILNGNFTTVGAGVTYNGFHVQGTSNGNPAATGSLTSSSGTLAVTTGIASGNLTTTDNQIRVKLVDFDGSTPLALVKNNVNSLGLDMPNTYTGGTTLNGGRLNANHAQAFGTGMVTVNSGAQAYLNVPVTFANNFSLNGTGVPEAAGNLGALRFQNNTVSGNITVATPSRIVAYTATTGTLSGSLLGSADLEVNSTAASINGVVNLTGNTSAYTGTLTLSQGTLNVSGALGGSATVTAGTATFGGTVAGNVTVNGGTANLSGNVTGDITVNDGATLAGEVTATNLTLGSSTGANFVANASTAGALTVTGLAVNGVVNVSLTGAAASPGPITLVNFTEFGGSAPTPANFTLANAASYRTATFAVNANTVTVNTGAVASIWTGSANGNWNLATDTNFATPGPVATSFFAGDSVTFDDSSAINTVDLVGTLSPGAVTINNTSATYLFQGAGALTGAFSLTKSGTGTATLGGSGVNTFTGNIAVNAGVLQMGKQSAFGANSSISIASGARVNINGQSFAGLATGGYSWSIAGDGGDGVGGLGAITNSGGDVFASGGVKFLTLTGNAEIGGNNGRFDIGRQEANATYGAVNGAGFTLTKVGTNLIVVRSPASNITYTVTAGRLSFEDFDSASGTNPITVTGTGTQLGTYGTRILPNNVSLGDGTTLISIGGAIGTWTGAITLGGNATFQADNGLIIAGSLAGSGTITRNGGNTLYITGSSPAFTGTLTSNGAVTFGNNTIAGSLSNAAALNQVSGTLTLAYATSISDPLPPVTLGTGVLANVANTLGATTTLNKAVNAGNLNGVFRVSSGGLTLGSGAAVTVGNLQVQGPITNRGILNILPGASVTTNYFEVSSTAANNFGVVNQSGGTVTLNSGSTGFRLGHWNSGSSTVPNELNITGGTFDATALSANAGTAQMVNVGWDGHGVMTVGGGASLATLKAYGIKLDANGESTTYNCTLTLSPNGLLEVGAGGISNNTTTTTGLNDRLLYNGGTAKTTVTGAWSTPATVNAATSSSVEVPTGLTLTLTGAMIGTGTLNKTGAGNLVLTTANIAGFTGTLGANGGNLCPGGNGTVGTLTLASGATLSVGTGGAVLFELNGASTVTGNDLVAVNGNLTFASGSYVRPVFAGAPSDGNLYKLFTYTGTLTGAPVVDPVYESGTRVVYDIITSTPGEVGLQVVGTVASLVWAGNGTNNNWDLATTQDWLNSGSPDSFFNSDSVTFSDTGDNAVPVNLTGTLSPAGFTVNNTAKDYVFSGTGTLTGGSGLTKSGTGKVTFTNPNAHISTGAVVINAGTVQIGTGGTTGTLPGANAITLAAGSTLDFNRSDNISLARAVTGTGGTVVKNGAGSLTTSLGGNTSNFTINGGTFFARGGGFSAAFAAGKLITMNPGTTLDTAVHTMGSSVGGGGDVPMVTLNGSNWILNGEQYMRTLTLNAATTTKVAALDGIRTLSGSVYTVQAAATSSTIGSPLNLVNALSLVVNDGAAADDLVISGLISNVGAVTKTGAGKVSITGTANTATAAFNINAGTVSVPVLNDSTVAGPLAQGAVTLNGGTLEYTGATATSARVLALGVSGGTVSVSDAAANLTLTGALVANSLTKTGPGTLTLNATNSHATTTILAGKLVPAAADSLGAGSVMLTGGSLDVNGLTLLPANTVVVGAAGTLVGAGIFTPGGPVAGTINPGGTGVAGRIASATDLTLGSTAVVNLEIGGTTGGSFDVLESQATIVLGGTVNLSLINGFSPVLGNSWDLIVDDGQSGSVTLGTLPTLGAGLAWKTDTFASTGVVSIVSSDPIPSWAATYGLSGNNALPGADPDGDGISNALEYAFGTSPIANNGPEYRGVASTTSGALSLTYRRPLNGVSGVTYGVEFKTADLVVGNTGWTTGVLNTHYTQIVTPNGDGTTETVVINLTGAVSGKKFARVAVTY